MLQSIYTPSWPESSGNMKIIIMGFFSKWKWTSNFNNCVWMTPVHNAACNKKGAVCCLVYVWWSWKFYVNLYSFYTRSIFTPQSQSFVTDRRPFLLLLWPEVISSLLTISFFKNFKLSTNLDHNSSFSKPF